MSETSESDRSAWGLRIAALAIIVPLATGLGWMVWRGPGPSNDPENRASTSTSTSGPDRPQRDAPATTRADSVAALRQAREKDPRYVNFGPIVFWWDALPDELFEVALPTGPESNMHLEDYAGPDSCKKCHSAQYEQWWEHAHRRMNAVADDANVEGEFSGDATINYLGGTATFFQKDGQYRMRLERDTRLVYEVRQTIGSRFFQYYIGRLIEGPFPDDHPYRTVNHVLPFGYWLDRQMWVPVVHVGPERPDGERDDPFAPAAEPLKGQDFSPYAANCSMCHTTYPLGDDLTRKPLEIAKHAPAMLHWNMSAYFREQHPELWGDLEHPADVSEAGIHALPEQLMAYEASEHGVSLGITCESCHLGSRAHAENPKQLPDFHPHSPYLFMQTDEPQLNTGRVHQNLNWACGRCHVGERPRFAAGMSTWNSVEYSDAMLGSCYSQLKCIDCHSPHEGIGHKWSKTPEQDDQSCIRCHSQYASDQAIQRHTHHEVGSAGARCMNCHMPRINEGLQDVVRTHMIYSPTNAEMIEANHPNACNLCHTDKPIDWTLGHLKDWYDVTYDDAAIAKNYPDREAPVAAGWMKHEYEPVRLLGADAACRANDRSLLSNVIDMLNDPFLINRQFTAARLEKLLGVDLDQFNYRFYHTPSERKEAIDQLRAYVTEMETAQ